jgi:thiol-disulfide isomerase/thioredoxin/uncharacterized membrane protein YphA (DoxX/SURF4 family)
MLSLLLFFRIVTSVIFFVASVTKLADIAGTRQAMVGFGVPIRFAALLGVTLAVAELIIAVLLIPTYTAWLAALGALILVTIFMTAIGLSLLRGQRPNCHCFGQLYSEPIGLHTLLRASLLGLMIGWVVWTGRDNPGPSLPQVLGALPPTQQMGLIGLVVLSGVCGVMSWFQLHLLKQHGRLLVRIEVLESQLARNGFAVGGAPPVAAGLPVSSKAPSFELTSLSEEKVTLESLRSFRKPVLLLFLDPDCGPCNALLPDVARWQNIYDAKRTIAIISRGSVESNREKTQANTITNCLLQEDREIAEKYKCYGTPGAVLVLESGLIGSPLAMGADAIKKLVEQTSESRVHDFATATNGSPHDRRFSVSIPSLSTGEKVPDWNLPEVGGATINLRTLGKPHLLLFWNPKCGFCNRMLDDIKMLERESSAAIPPLLFVSSGSTDEIQALAVRSPVAIDNDFRTGRLFGASGTPSAILLNEAGIVASKLAVGAQEILALASNQPVNA